MLVDVCPVNCIHGLPEDEQLYIDPQACIECYACLYVCPVDAIVPSQELLPEQRSALALNADYVRAHTKPVACVSAVCRGETRGLP